MRLIDKDQLLRDLNTGMNIVEMMQTVIDAKEVKPKTGRWIECDHEKWVVGVHALRCSECNGGYHLSNEMTIYYWNYCPNCGSYNGGGA